MPADTKTQRLVRVGRGGGNLDTAPRRRNRRFRVAAERLKHYPKLSLISVVKGVCALMSSAWRWQGWTREWLSEPNTKGTGNTRSRDRPAGTPSLGNAPARRMWPKRGGYHLHERVVNQTHMLRSGWRGIGAQKAKTTMHAAAEPHEIASFCSPSVSDELPGSLTNSSLLAFLLRSLRGFRAM